MNGVERQREYYRNTAARYDEMHDSETGVASLPYAFVNFALTHLDCRNVLEIGSGTGTVLRALASAHSGVRFVGVEPVPELREQGFSKGLSRDQLVDGDAMRLSYPNRSFDLVFAMAVLHHVPRPARAVAEMLRVARRGIVICDDNNFGQGGYLIRSLKQVLKLLGLWGAANWLKTGGRGYIETEGDGISYSYSVFSNLPQIRRRCSSVHIMNTSPAGTNPYRTAKSVAVLGILNKD